MSDDLERTTKICMAAVKQLEIAEAECDQLQARVAELEMALDFYADPETYLAIGFFPDPPCGEFMEDWSDTGKELGWRPGKRARAALQEEAGDGKLQNAAHKVLNPEPSDG